MKKFSVLYNDELYEKVRRYAFKNKIKFAEAVRLLTQKGLEK